MASKSSFYTANPANDGAPGDGIYVVKEASSTLTAERVLTDSATVTWNWATAGQVSGTAIAVLADADYGDITVSGTGTVFTIDSDVISTFGRTLTDDADAATARATLGLVIGTNVQAYDATLLSLAALGTAANKFAYTTALDTWAEADITAAGLSMAAAANATAQTALLDAFTGDSGAGGLKGLVPAPAAGDAAALKYLLADGTWAAVSVAAPLTLTLDDATNNAVSTILTLVHTSSGAPAAGIGAGLDFSVETAAGNNEIGAHIQAVATDVTSTSEDFDLLFGLMVAGAAAAAELRLTSTALQPETSDGLALGTTTKMWADLHLATGAVVNWNNGDVSVTHSANTLTFEGASSGYVFRHGSLLPYSNDAVAVGASGNAFSDLFLASGAVINFDASDVTLTHAANLLTLAGGNFVIPDATSIAGMVKTIQVVIDGGGSVITTGIKGDLHMSEACTILNATLLADQAGSIVIDVWKDSYANYPPTVADTITAAAKPTLSAATKSQDTTLTGWTTTIAAGDILRFNVDSAATVTRVLLTLKVQLD